MRPPRPSPPAPPQRALRALTVLHRWVGLATALFLFLAGATGAVIAFDHELDARLAPALYRAASAGTAQDPLDLADALEARDPRMLVTYLPLATHPGATLLVSVAPRTPEVGELGFDQVALDPATGQVQAQRRSGALAWSAAAIVPALYRLRYSMWLPGSWGTFAMGAVAMAWVLDCFVALAISFPNPRNWHRSLQFSWRHGGRRLLYDLHRSGGVWVWGALLVVAVTAVSMNLEAQVVRPLVGWFSPLAPDS